MKNILLLGVGIIAAIIGFSAIGPLAVIAVSLIILYYSVKGYKESTSRSSKFLLFIIGAASAITAVANVPALLGVLAIYIVYKVYMAMTGSNDHTIETPASDDPFVNFENEWANLTK